MHIGADNKSLAHGASFTIGAGGIKARCDNGDWGAINQAQALPED
jgi:hypothetical protein